MHESWYDNGELKEKVNYNYNNQRNGLYQKWHKNGQLWEVANFKNDKLHGLYKNWYDNGQLRLEENYKNGKAISKMNPTERLIEWFEEADIEELYRILKNYKKENE